MKHFKIILSFVLQLILFSTDCIAQSIRVPAEWEKQEAVHLAWYGNIRRDSVLCRVIEALQPTVSVVLHIPAISLKRSITQVLSDYKVDTAAISYIEDPDTDFWTRDPLYFAIENNQLKVVCFNYSMYGIYPDLAGEPLPDEIKRIGEFDERMAKRLQLPVIKSDYIFEGGGLETNGKGTFLVIKEMALQRNPGKTLPEIESELMRTVGARKIIWLAKGLIEDRIMNQFGPFYKNYFGGGANMHIDELCRFVNENTVVMPFISESDRSNSPVDSINYLMLEQNYQILKSSTTADGEALSIIRLKMPEIEVLKYTQVIDSNSVHSVKQFGFAVGDTIYRIPAASYMNYFISNEVVLIPKYWKHGMAESQREKDEEARDMLSQLFPDRKIVQIFTLSINRGGGGIHCMTHEQPLVENK
jgi:agmatine deiminase